MLSEAATQSLQARTGTDEVAAVPSRRWRSKFEENYQIKTGNAEVLTPAREIATSSVRNAVSFATMLQFIVTDHKVHAALKLNADATAFTIGSGCGKTNRAGRGENSKRPLKTRQFTKKPQTLPYTLKTYILISVEGYLCPPVYIIPDKRMPADAIDVHEAPCLGIGTVHCYYHSFPRSSR